MKNMIEVKGLCKSYPDFALKHVSFQVPGGSTMGLIGENGAGKTTTLKSLLGLTRFEGGEIFLLGCPVPQRERTVKQDVGMVLDDCFFHDALKAREIDKILAPVFRNWDSGLFRDYLNKFKLPEKKLVKEYSRGMKMKLSLAAALAHHPRLLILDEATSGLDPVVRDEILDEFLGFICDEDHAILLSSHITTDLEKVADYITYLHQGEVVLSDSKDTILEEYGRVGCTAGDLTKIAHEDYVRLRRGTFGNELLVSNRKSFAKKYPGLTVDRVSLEDIMLFVGKGEAQ